MSTLYLTVLAIMSLITLALYGADKLMAVGQTRRIPETVLLLFTAMGGVAGALIGTLVFHHKTNVGGKWHFWCVIAVSLFVQIAMLLLILGTVAF